MKCALLVLLAVTSQAFADQPSPYQLPQVINVQLNVTGVSDVSQYISDKQISIKGQTNWGNITTHSENTNAHGFVSLEIPENQKFAMLNFCAKMNGPYYCFQPFTDFIYNSTGPNTATATTQEMNYLSADGQMITADQVPLACTMKLLSITMPTDDDGDTVLQSNFEFDCSSKSN